MIKGFTKSCTYGVGAVSNSDALHREVLVKFRMLNLAYCNYLALSCNSMVSTFF